MAGPDFDTVKVHIKIPKIRSPLEVANVIARLVYPDREPLLRASFERESSEGVIISQGAVVYFSSSTDSGDLYSDIAGRTTPDLLVERGKFAGYYLHIDPEALRFRPITDEQLRKELLRIPQE